MPPIEKPDLNKPDLNKPDLNKPDLNKPDLNKPDLNKPVFNVFPKAREYIMHDRCPHCKKVINTGTILLKDHTREELSSPFKDALSKKEYSISGLCQDCQDEVFG